MKLRNTAVAVVTAASLLLIPTAAYAGGSQDGGRGDQQHWSTECRDRDKWKDHKYAPECECDKDHDHRDKDRDKPKTDKPATAEPQKRVRQPTYQGRVLKTG